MTIAELAELDRHVENARFAGGFWLSEGDLAMYRQTVGLAQFCLARGIAIQESDAPFIRRVASLAQEAITKDGG